MSEETQETQATPPEERGGFLNFVADASDVVGDAIGSSAKLLQMVPALGDVAEVIAEGTKMNLKAGADVLRAGSAALDGDMDAAIEHTKDGAVEWAEGSARTVASLVPIPGVGLVAKHVAGEEAKELMEAIVGRGGQGGDDVPELKQFTEVHASDMRDGPKPKKTELT